ncbi:MAG: ABC transporter ATP-binding protein, partial [Brevundimonas sp.]|uniref:ABC transporter ATP-binding protein n=1 Tax=Brevundimonas sp. TaxID=1871086 RepID=UPI00391D8451
MITEILICSRLTRRFGKRLAVDGVSLTLAPGRITALLGPSGCGKSTLLRLIAGLEPLDDGEILYGETLIASPAEALPPERRRIGLVFQDHALFPHLSVRDNVAFGLAGRPRAERHEITARWLTRVGLGDRGRDWPHQLSGGQQQRVALARALAPAPRAVLLDEPFSSLDAHLRGEVRQDIAGALRDAGTAALVVTHDARDAMLMADDLILMDRGQVLQAGSPEACYARPASLDAARLLGDIEVIAGERRDGRVETPLGRFEARGSNGACRLMFRPEALRRAPPGGEGPGTAGAHGGAASAVRRKGGAAG